jgi:hypothetical protein
MELEAHTVCLSGAVKQRKFEQNNFFRLPEYDLLLGFSLLPLNQLETIYGFNTLPTRSCYKKMVFDFVIYFVIFRIMETGSELSKTVATFILQKILQDETGLYYICQTYDR